MRASPPSWAGAICTLAIIASGFAAACSGDDNAGGATQQDAAFEQAAGSGGTSGTGGATGTGGTTGTGGSAGTGGNAGVAGSGGSGVDASIEGGGNGEPEASVVDVPVFMPDPALGPDAGTIGCPTIVNGSLDTSDGRQTGRYSRIAPISACGMTKANPSTAADPGNPHFYDVYRFANPTAAPVCFTFTLTYGAVMEGGSETAGDAEAGADGPGADAVDAQGEEHAAVGDALAESVSVDSSEDDSTVDGNADAGTDGVADAVSADVAASDGSDGSVTIIGPARYMAAFNTFYPTDLTIGYLGDVGDKVTSPQTMGITVPAGRSIDVVVYAIDVAPAGVGSYTLACSTQ